MTRRNLLAAVGLTATGTGVGVTDLPRLPQPVAGQFVGAHAGRLIVAGGTCWSRPKWEGGEKRWTPVIYTLGPDRTGWRKSGEQAEPLAYGGAVNTSAGVVCIAGQGPDAATVWALRAADGELESRPLACGILLSGGRLERLAHTARARCRRSGLLRLVLPGGEDRPGSRSARVLLVQGLI
jgi:hypothetical protein